MHTTATAVSLQPDPGPSQVAAGGQQRRLRAELALLGSISAIGLLATMVTALRPVRVTAGWTDQSHFHMPTIVEMARRLPELNITDVLTATGPLYHLTLALPARAFHLPDAVIQIIGGWLYLTLLAAVVLWASRGLPGAVRLPVGTAVVASPYVWESTLWTLTDTAALALGLVALTLLCRPVVSLRRAVVAGLIIALAIATRQTFAWLLLPAFVTGLSATGARSRILSITVICVPGAAALTAMVMAWGGLTPPRFENINGAGPNVAGIAYGFSLWTFFVCPLLWAATRRVPGYRRGQLTTAAAIGLVAAATAIIWPSNYDKDRDVRKGGWLWSLVHATGDFDARSPLLVVLAFVGAAASVLLVIEVSSQRGWIPAGVLGTAIAGSILSAAAATQAYQKYYEVPLLICYVAAALALSPERCTTAPRRVPLTIPAGIQVLALSAVVGFPVVAALLEPHP